MLGSSPVCSNATLFHDFDSRSCTPMGIQKSISNGVNFSNTMLRQNHANDMRLCQPS